MDTLAMMTEEQVDLVKAYFSHLKVIPDIEIRDEDTGISIGDALFISPCYPVIVKTIGGDKKLAGYILVGGEGDDIGEPIVSFNKICHQALICWINWLVCDQFLIEP